MKVLLNTVADQSINSVRGPEGIRSATVDAATQAEIDTPPATENAAEASEPPGSG